MEIEKGLGKQDYYRFFDGIYEGIYELDSAAVGSPWLHSWFFSFMTLLIIIGILTGFGALVYVVIYRIWGEEPCENTCNSDEERAVKEPTMRKAA